MDLQDVVRTARKVERISRAAQDLIRVVRLALRAKQGEELSPREFRALERAGGDPVEGESVRDLADRVLGDYHARRGPFAPAG